MNYSISIVSNSCMHTSGNSNLQLYHLEMLKDTFFDIGSAEYSVFVLQHK